MKELLELKDKLQSKLVIIQNKLDAIEVLLRTDEEEAVFILPERWCILRNRENYGVVNNWFFRKGYGKPFEDYGYISINHEGTEFCTHHKLQGGYTEITFEQFKKYVVNDKRRSN